MGRRTNLRLAQSKPPLGQGFRGFDRQRQSLGLHRLRAAARQATVLPIAQPIRLRFGHLSRMTKVSSSVASIASTYVASIWPKVLRIIQRFNEGITSPVVTGWPSWN